jgi:hypothetical protein
MRLNGDRAGRHLEVSARRRDDHTGQIMLRQAVGPAELGSDRGEKLLVESHVNTLRGSRR